MKHILAILCVFLFSTAVLPAQNVEFSGHFRERSEFDDRSFFEESHHDVYHVLRVRLRADAQVNEQVRVVAELQDARTFGQEASVLNTGAAHFDLRQGFVEVTGLADGLLSFKLGRQVLAYGNQRLLGESPWNNFSRSFDAGVLRLTGGEFSFDAIGAAVTRNPVNPDYMRDVFLAGGWAVWAPAERDYTVEGFLLYDNPEGSSVPEGGTVRQNRMTAGFYSAGQAGNFDYKVDAALQTGDYMPLAPGSESRDISANLIGVRLGYTFENLAELRLGAGIDRLSGQDPDDPDTYGAFNTLYASNHRSYGHMDYFTNIPLHTDELGLQNIIVQASLVPAGGLTVGADVHLFSTVIDPAERGGSSAEFEQSIGTEIDAYAKWTIADAVNMTLGYSMFSGSENRPLLPGTADAANWGYLMTTVNF